MSTSTLTKVTILPAVPQNGDAREQFMINADRLCELAYVEGDNAARKLIQQLLAQVHDMQLAIGATADTIKLIDTYRVVFTHEQVHEYAKIDLVGQYLLAASLVNGRLAPFRDRVKTLVDFGCGAGKSTRAVEISVRPGGTIIGVDISQDFLDQAKILSSPPHHVPGARYIFKKIDVSGETERIDLEDGIADAVTTTIVLQELQTESLLRSSLVEMGRIAKRGAQVALACVSDQITCQDFTTFTYAPFPENGRRDDNVRKCQSTVSKIVWEHDRHWSKEILVDGLRTAGFTNIQVEYPLASNNLRPYPANLELEWKDELIFAPLMLITGEKS